MRKMTVAALVLLGCVSAWTQVRGEQRARSWEISPYAGVSSGSGATGNSEEPTFGLRFSYNLDRWWAVELGYSVTDNINFEQTVGRRLSGGQDEFGRGVWLEIPLDGRAESEADSFDLNLILGTKPLKRRFTFYGTVGLGRASFSGAMTQQQIDAAFPLGPNPIPDAFDFDQDGSQTDLVDEFACYTCAIVVTDPNNPSTSRAFRATGTETPEVTSTQWNIGGGMRMQFTDAMALRVDLRDYNGLTETYNNVVLSAGLSFRFGGETKIDEDGDGIPDFRDHCPDTPTGATVDALGCPSDSDGDEILDGLDACANTPSGWPVDETGCPLDTDGDGVPDGKDTCAATPEGAVVDFEGCPVDSDGDAVPDGLDQCAATPTGAKVDEQGCPLDADGDGVPDGIDACDATPAGLKVDAKGCPIDSDGDGLKDDVDKCMDFAGPGGVDAEGCPVLRLDKSARVNLPTVRFASGSSTLTDEARAELTALVAAMKYYADVTIDVEGHTDDVGSERDNFLMSLERARSVRRFLVDSGIMPERITARGFGEIRPVADNATAEGRAQNRRIEVLVTGTLPKEGEGAGTPAGGGGR